MRGAAQELIRHAKETGAVLLLVGHVTKEGQIAGPKVLEHMVDTVLYFEGERGHQFRILRAVKNRFGPTDEIGVFEMTDHGLDEVANPSALFLDRRDEDVAGTVVFAGIEGSRPMLMEIQALVAPSALGTPAARRGGLGFGRLAMVLAVLDTRCGLALGGHDVYLNVAGGLQRARAGRGPCRGGGADLVDRGRPLPKDCIYFGEIGLAGEVRAVSQADTRLNEAAKLGFKRAVTPARKSRKGKVEGMTVDAVDQLGALVDMIYGNDGRR